MGRNQFRLLASVQAVSGSPHSGAYAYIAAGENAGFDAEVFIYVVEAEKASPVVGKVNFKLVDTDTVAYGTTPSYAGTTPTKTGDAQYSYTFAGWTPAVVAVTGNVIYTAQFDSTVNKYTVTWKNWDGTVLDTDTVAYGTTPSYTGATPTKAADAQYTYTFTGWDSEVVAVTGNVIYTAQYSTAAKSYTLTVNYTGVPGQTIASHTEQLAYGASYSVTSPTVEGYTADPAVVTGAMPAADHTVTVTYTCAHGRDQFGVCTTIGCDHLDTCTCAPDKTDGQRTITIYTLDADRQPMANVPVSLMMNPNTGKDHTELYYGVTDGNGALVVPAEYLASVVADANLYVSVTPNRAESKQTHDWAWDTSTTCVRTVNAIANTKILEAAKQQYAQIRANTGTGFNADITIYVKETVTEPEIPVEVVGKVNYILQDANGQTITAPVTMRLNMRNGSDVTYLGTVIVEGGKGTLTLNAETLATLPVGALLDCDPMDGYVWALAECNNLVRTMTINSGSIEKGNNANADAKIIAESLTNGFEITFICKIKSDGTTQPDTPEVQGIVHFDVEDTAGNPVNCTMNLVKTVNGERIVAGTATIVNGEGTVILDAAALAEIPVGTSLDCDPAGGYEWALGDVAIVRTIESMDGAIAKGNNINHDVKITNATAANGFTVTFECIVK